MQRIQVQNSVDIWRLFDSTTISFFQKRSLTEAKLVTTENLSRHDLIKNFPIYEINTYLKFLAYGDS